MNKPAVNLEQLIEYEFPVTESLVHLNHAAVAPWPTRTTEAVIRFARENNAVSSKNFNDWLASEQHVRELARELVGANYADDIALVKNTSEGLSMVAHGFPWQAGDNVVISNEEFPSNRVVWESLKEKGVEVRRVSLPCPGDVEHALIDATDSSTRMLSISSVQFASGLKTDLLKLGELCKRRNIAFCVDAIQGLGVFPHDVQSMHIDFLVADGHKWLLSPEGLGVFYCTPEWRDRLQLHEYGWRMLENPFDMMKEEWRPVSTAQRFECGTQNSMGIVAMEQSLSLLLEIGIDEIWKRVQERTEFLFEKIENQDALQLISCNEKGRYAGITVFKHNKVSDQELYERLSSNNVLCAMRGGGIRFSPHFYVPLDSLNTAIELAVSQGR
jgi:cysteine desulfurase/selenocysteine lyase